MHRSRGRAPGPASQRGLLPGRRAFGGCVAAAAAAAAGAGAAGGGGVGFDAVVNSNHCLAPRNECPYPSLPPGLSAPQQQPPLSQLPIGGGSTTFPPAAAPPRPAATPAPSLKAALIVADWRLAGLHRFSPAAGVLFAVAESFCKTFSATYVLWQGFVRERSRVEGAAASQAVQSAGALPAARGAPALLAPGIPPSPAEVAITVLLLQSSMYAQAARDALPAASSKRWRKRFLSKAAPGAFQSDALPAIAAFADAGEAAVALAAVPPLLQRWTAAYVAVVDCLLTEQPAAKTSDGCPVAAFRGSGSDTAVADDAAKSRAVPATGVPTSPQSSAAISGTAISDSLPNSPISVFLRMPRRDLQDVWPGPPPALGLPPAFYRRFLAGDAATAGHIIIRDGKIVLSRFTLQTVLPALPFPSVAEAAFCRFVARDTDFWGLDFRFPAGPAADASHILLAFLFLHYKEILAAERRARWSTWPAAFKVLAEKNAGELAQLNLDVLQLAWEIAVAALHADFPEGTDCAVGDAVISVAGGAAVGAAGANGSVACRTAVGAAGGTAAGTSSGAGPSSPQPPVVDPADIDEMFALYVKQPAAATRRAAAAAGLPPGGAECRSKRWRRGSTGNLP